MLCVFLAGCGSAVGEPIDFAELGYSTCSGPFDCGPGRYCGSEGLCQADCRSSADCALAGEGLLCNRYGHCLPPEGTHPCRAHTDCGSGGYCNGTCSGSGALCGNDDECPILGESCTGNCAANCGTDNDCLPYPGEQECTPVGLCLLPGWERWIPALAAPPSDCRMDAQCKGLGWTYRCDCERVPDSYYGEVCAGSGRGICVEDSAPIDFGGGPADSPAHRLVGVWGMRSNAANLTIGLPLIQIQATVDTNLTLVKVSHAAGDILQLETKTCDIQLLNFIDSDEPFPDLGWMVIPARFLKSLPIRSLQVEVKRFHRLAPFKTNESLEVHGARLPDPRNDPLPGREDYLRDPDDPRFWDQDEDGNVGMTTIMDGVLRGEIYHVHRFTSTNYGLILDQDHIRGLSVATSEKKVIEASNPILVYEVGFAMHEQPDRTFFRMMRMSDDATCADLIREGNRFDSFLRFTPHLMDVADP